MRPHLACSITLSASLLACEGNTWVTSDPRHGADVSLAPHAAPAMRTPATPTNDLDASLHVDVATPHVDASRDRITATELDATRDASNDGGDAEASAQMAFIPWRFYAPTGAAQAAPEAVTAPPAGVNAASVGSAPNASTFGNPGMLGQYGTPGAFSTSGVTAGDPGPPPGLNNAPPLVPIAPPLPM
jgi:hypothetical protein